MTVPTTEWLRKAGAAKHVMDQELWKGVGGLGAPFFYGTDALIKTVENDVFRQALAVSKIPGLHYLGYTPDMHVGFGTSVGTIAVWPEKGAMISPSIVGVDIGCGMSLMTTNVKTAGLDKTIIRKMMQEIEAMCPAGEGKTRMMYRDMPMSEFADLFAASLLGDDDTFLWTFCRGDLDAGRYEPLALDGLPAMPVRDAIGDRAWQRGVDTVGTLGGGNHFLELQTVEVIDEEICKAWGIEPGTLAFMIHSGSRGLGHQVGQESEKIMETEMAAWGMKSDEPGLTWGPLNLPNGKQYFANQLIAANASKVNRAIIRKAVCRVLDSVLKEQAFLLYDVCHNYAEKEYHDGKPYIVHRKGATRALPAGHFMLKDTPYFETGHPVLIPGAMGRPSYVLVGLPGAAESFYSINHGAGRVMSRTAARKNLSDADVTAALGDLLINTRNVGEIKDEAPQAYKDIDEIIRTVEEAGLAKVVAKFTALGCIKGAERQRR